MDKKLEARIARLERELNCKFVKNEDDSRSTRRKIEATAHRDLTASPLIDKYTEAVQDINKFNQQLKDSLFGMIRIVSETTPDNMEATYKGKDFQELDAFARESLDVIKSCLSDCSNVLARLKVILYHNQSAM